MHNISFFSWFVFDEFIVKGEEYEHKVGRTLANQVDERRNMINDYLRGELALRVLGGVDFRGVLILSFCIDFELFLLFWAFLRSSCHFAWICRFSCRLLAFVVFSLLDDLLELFFGFLGLLDVFHGVLDLNFNLCAFVVNGLIKGEIEKPSGPVLGLIVMSHWLSEVWIQIRDNFVLFFFYLCFVWRIMFACLMVCRWQVWHGV
jgi:hypothetical protein